MGKNNKKTTRKLIPVSKPMADKKELNALKRVLDSGRYANGPEIRKFEQEFANYINVSYAVATSSGTTALISALVACGVGKGDEVILPALSFFATTEAVLFIGAKPIFVDVNEDGNIEGTLIEEKINENTTAIIPVHMYGMPCNMLEIMRLANTYGLFVIEDCSQAHGAELNGRKVGSFGHIGCFSLYATKNMTSAGEGGICVTNNKTFTERIKRFINHGMTDHNTHEYLGYNFRMTEFQAAFAREQLKKLDLFNRKRIENSEYIFRELEFPLINSVFFWCPVWVYDGLKAKEWFAKKGVEVRRRIHFMPNQPIIKKLGLKPNEDFPMACELNGCLIGLPNWPGLTKKELRYIVKCTKEYLSQEQKDILGLN